MNNDFYSLLYTEEDQDYKFRNNQYIRKIHSCCHKLKFNDQCYIYIKDNNKKKTIVHDCSTGNFPYIVIDEFLTQKEFNYILIDNTGYRYATTKQDIVFYNLAEINILNSEVLQCIRSMGYDDLYIITICAAIYFWDICCSKNQSLFSKLIMFSPAVRGQHIYLANGMNKDFFDRSAKLTDDIVTTKLYLSNDLLKETDKEIIPKQTYFNNKLKLEIQNKIVGSEYMVKQLRTIENKHAIMPEKDNFYNLIGMGLDLFNTSNCSVIPTDHYSYYFNPDKIFTNKIYQIVGEY